MTSRKPPKTGQPAGSALSVPPLSFPLESQPSDFVGPPEEVFGWDIPDDIFTAHLKEPDNWLRVPDFYPPADQGSKFRGQIESDNERHPHLTNAARRIVKASRHLAHQSFRTMDDLRDSLAEYLDLSSRKESFDAIVPTSKRMRDAVYYTIVIDQLDDALRETTRPHAEVRFLEAVSMFADWAADDGTKPLPIADRMRQIAEKPRPNARTHDHRELQETFERYKREGYTEREARGKLVASGKYGSQPTIYRVTSKK